MRLAVIFNGSRPDTVGYYIVRACQALGIAAQAYGLDQLRTVPAEYDAYLRIDHGDDYDVLWPAALRPRLFFVSDTHVRHSWKKIRRIAAHYDLMCCAQSAAAARLPNAVWVPFACDPQLHAPPDQVLQRYEIVFVGTDGGTPRKFVLQALRERCPNSLVGKAPHTAMSALYSAGKIGFNYSIAHEVNMRVFEVLAARTCLVTNVLPSAELAALGLRDGEHLVMYRSEDQLLPALELLLADASRRGRIAQAGFDVVRRRHTYAHRVAQMLQAAMQRGCLREQPLPTVGVSAP